LEISVFSRQSHSHFLVLDQKETYGFLKAFDLRLPIFSERLLLNGQAKPGLFLVSHWISLSLEDESAVAIRDLEQLEFSDNPDRSKTDHASR
jgi:hypothetical protein